MSIYKKDYQPSELRNKFTDEVLEDAYKTWVVWHENSPFPLTFDVNITDFVSMILLFENGTDLDFIENIQVIYGPAGGAVIYCISKVDFIWKMEVIGWSNNSTSIIYMEPWFPDATFDLESVKPGKENHAKFELCIDDACEILDNLIHYFKLVDLPPWFTKDMTQEIRQRNINKGGDLEDIFRNDPPEWVEVVKRFLQYKTDKKIAYELNLTEGYVSQILYRVRQVHPELRLYRGRPEKHTNTKGSIKKTKEQIKI